MTQNELFWRLLVTGLLLISSAVQLARRSYAMAALLIIIPLAGWLAIWLGQ